MQYLILDMEESNDNSRYILLEFPNRTSTGWRSIHNIFSNEFKLIRTDIYSIEEYFNEVAGVRMICSAPTITYEYLTIHHPELLL